MVNLEMLERSSKSLHGRLTSSPSTKIIGGKVTEMDAGLFVEILSHQQYMASRQGGIDYFKSRSHNRGCYIMEPV